MINEMFKGAMRGTSNRPASQFFSLINHKVEITNAQPMASKILTNSSKGIPKGWLVDSFRRTIYTRQNPRAIGGGGVRKAPGRNVISVCKETLQLHT
jgi:hypothetical protein